MAKRTVLAALALVLLAGPAAMTQAKEPGLVTFDRGLTESVMTMRVRGDLTFGPDGLVKEHHIATKLGPEVAVYVDRAIGKLKFRPYLQDGVPVNAKTYFQMTLAARPNGADSYELGVDGLHFNDKAFRTWQEELERTKNPGKCIENCIVSQPPAPRYGGVQVNGGVIVHLYLNPDGTVADAVVAQSALYSVRGMDRVIDGVRKQFEKIALNYARQVRFAPGSGSPLVGDNHFVGALPFDFALENAKTDNEGVWRLEQRSHRNVASWLANAPDRWIGISETAGGGFLAMKDSKYKLVADPASAP